MMLTVAIGEYLRACKNISRGLPVYLWCSLGQLTTIEWPQGFHLTAGAHAVAQLTSEGGSDTASNAALMRARCSAVSGVTGSGMYGVRVLQTQENHL